MESPLNKKIQRSLERTAAKKKKDSNYVPVLTLRQQVLSLVTEANKSAQSERQVTPRSALIVMDRALASLAVVDEESRDFAVLREVSSFISTAQKTSVMTASAHTDLLPQGHPLSALNASLTPEEYRFKYAQWLAADADVSSAARPLVAAAFSAKPGSIERNHAFMRLSVTTEKVPGYFKLDPAPIIAAFSDGNSSAARRARVALQWRDKRGRWVEMGRGANFRYRTSSGGVASASGVYVGVRPKQPGENYTAGLIQVSGDKNLPDGIYAVRPSNTETYSARVPLEALEKAGITPGATPSQSMLGVPSQDEILATRKDAPEGWKKNSDNTFTSDDNYTVKGGDGEYTLYRQNEDGSLGDKVGEAGNWAEINELANNDQDAYDEVKGQASSPEAREQVKARIATRTKHNEEFDRLEELVKSGVDQNGNKVPEGWEGIVRPGRAAFIERRAIGADRVIDEEGLPSVEYRKAIAYDYDTEPVYAEAGYDRLGKFAAYDKQYDSWEEAEADIPRWIAAEEKRRDRKLEPIESQEIKLPEFEDGPSDYVRFGPEPDDADYRAGFFDKDGNRLPGPPASDDPLPALTDEQKKKIDAEIRDLIENPPAPTEMDKRVEKLLREQRAEWDKAKEENYARIFDKDELDAEEIYNRRMAGESLDKVAKDLGLTREEVRRIEAKYARENGGAGGDGGDPEDPSSLWGSVNSIEKPDGKTFDIILAEMDEPWDDDKTIMQHVVDQANELGIHVGISPDNYGGGLGFGDERVVRFTFPEKTVSEELAKKLIGEGPDSDEDGILMSRISSQDDWDEALQEITGDGPDEPPSPDFTNRFKEVKELAESGDVTPQQFFDALFKDAKYRLPTSKEIKDYGVPKDAKVFYIDEQNTFVQHSDGTWNDYDLDAPGESGGDKGIYDFFMDNFVKDTGDVSMVFYRGAFIDDDLQSAVEEQRDGDGDGDGPDEPPSGGGSNTPGSGFSDYVIDLASGNTDPDKDLQERLDEDVEELAVDFIENIYEDAGDVYDLAQDIKDNKPEGMSDKEFIDDAAAQMRENLEAIVDRAIEDRNDFVESGDAEPVDFDKETFINTAIERYKELVQEELDGIREDDGDGPDEPPTPPSGGDGGDPEDPSSLWGSVNSIEKPDGKTFDIILAEMDEPWDDDKTIMQHVVDQANELGIHVGISPDNYGGGLGFGDERVVRFTFPEKTVSEELAKKLIGEGPDSDEDGILMSRISSQDDWDEALQEITGDGPDEPPTPPSGGTPPKTPSPSTPSAPSLYKEFDVPNGAFELRGVDYEPEGRVDERSSNFTDDPEKLATRFSVQDLIAAFSEAILGNSSDASVAEILNANVGDDDEIDAPSEVDVNVNMPQVALGSPSGAGRLEFNAGEEFVLAESLFNALWHAGVDPNRVLANLYDSVNGDNKNLSKLIEAQGGTPSPEEAQLVDDITAEIRQIKDATPDGEPSIANQKNEPSTELKGSLIENVAIDFENPDYYIPDSSEYVPSQEEVDENGYTDNPKILATDFEVSDLIMQMLEGITDGSGAALLNFGDIITEVPVEAMRDALQYNGVNTNDILVDLKRESNDMSEAPELAQPSGLSEQISNQKIKDRNGGEFELNLVKIDDVYEGALINKENGRIQIVVRNASEREAKKVLREAGAYIKQAANGDEAMDDGVIPNLDRVESPVSPANRRLQAHSQMIKDLIEQTGNTIDDDTADKIRDAIDEKGLVDWSEANDAEIIEAIAEVAGPGVLGREVQEDETPVDSADLPRDPSVDVPVDSPEYETPQYSYPGPREAGYTPNNVVLDSNGAAVGAGARVQALSDGRAGTVLAVQNIDTKSGRDADYVRIRFDDGSTAVRSARQIFGIDAGAPLAQGEGPGQLPPARPNPVPQDPGQRFNEPAPAGTPVIAGDGSIPGVNLVDTPDDIAEFVNPDAKQADFAAWGLRAPEIARAGRERADVNKLVDLIEKEKAARVLASEAPTEDERNNAKAERGKYEAQIKKVINDSFGIRPGVKFGKSNYTIGDGSRIDYTISDSGEVLFSIAFSIQDERGRRVGEGSRTVRGLSDTDVLGNTTRKWVVTNNLLKIYNKKDQKSGFASAYNRYMEDWYIANGFSSINVFAAGGNSWSGGFVWAVNGFNWKGSQAGTVPTILRSMLRRSETSDEEKQIINRMLDRIAKDNPTGNYTPDTVPTPLEVALIGWYPGATNWLGKKQMKSMGWYGEKRLDPQAIEQRQAINYNQSRNALKRVKDKANRAGVSRDLVLKMNSNEFADANPELAPYLDQIRDVLRSNRSLAVLSPAAKTALNRFTASQLLKGEDRTVALQDIFKLRTALDAEFKADNPLAGSKDFGVGNQLLDISIDDVNANRVPGFTVRRLGMYESGINETFMLTHNDSGQVFFVKKDSYAAQYQINGAGAEVQADVMLRASGVVAGYEARVSNVDPEIIVMQRAGAGVPLLGEPMTASNAIGNKLSINLPDGTTVKVNASNFMDLLHTPEDAVRVILVDLIISNMDRHNGNLLLAVDGTDTGKIRLLPIDHALSSFSPNTEGMQYTVSELFDNSFDNLYGMAMPVLTKRLKQEELLDLFKNEARVMMQELNNPANLPTGKELDLIVKNFGSLDSYRQKIQERIDSLLVPGNEAHEAFLNVLKPGYWSTR
jgi:hypothetical protein